MADDKTQIREGCVVLVQKGAYLKTCRLFKGRSYTFGKRGDGQFTLNLDGALSCPYGSSFRMEKVSNRLFSVTREEHPIKSLDIVKEGGVDNRDLQDDGRSQKLTPEEILKLKNKGLTGKEVIQVITENSSTFRDKTVYSQEKYVNKKQKKYGEVITVHRPTIRLLNNMFYVQDPLKIANLRIDTLSQLLCHCNIQSGGNFAIFESGTQGLVTAAMLHRMGTAGHLVQVYHGGHPQREAVDLMNFTEQELRVLSFINVTKLPDTTQSNDLTSPTTTTTTTTSATEPMETNEKKMKVDVGDGHVQNNKESKEEEQNCENDELTNLSNKECESQDTKEQQNSEKTEQQETPEGKEQEQETPEGKKQEQETQGGEEQPKKQLPPRPRRFVRTQAEDLSMSSSVLAQGVVGLVVACRQYPNNVTREMLPFLKPGNPFVVFSPYKEPLMELYSEVRALGGTNLRLSETWLRHYQVLPQRTHPAINMSGGGGYLLYGTKVIKEP